jgi:hypothetical protein
MEAKISISYVAKIDLKVILQSLYLKTLTNEEDKIISRIVITLVFVIFW